MVDLGENISLALKREFGEEALNTDKFPHRIYIQTIEDYLSQIVFDSITVNII